MLRGYAVFALLFVACSCGCAHSDPVTRPGQCRGNGGGGGAGGDELGGQGGGGGVGGQGGELDPCPVQDTAQCADPSSGCCEWCWAVDPCDGLAKCFGPGIFSFCGLGGEACGGCAGNASECSDGVCL